MSCSQIFGFVISDALCSRDLRRPRDNPTMMSRITSALQAAADVVAPPCPRVEDLRYYWAQISGVCQMSLEMEQQPPAVEETHIPRYLEQMLMVLVAEEMAEGPLSSQNSSSSGGPSVKALSACMEFLLQEKVLPGLAQYAEADRPLGVRQHVYLFLIGILNHLHHSHLHHAPIHKPLQALVVASCNMTASPYETQEMEFLATLCEKIRQDNTLILLYIQPIALTSNTPTGSRSATPVYNSQPSIQTTLPQEEGSPTLTSKKNSIPGRTVPKFPLVDALLNLCHSADAPIAKQAHEYLIVVAGLRVPMCSSAIAQHTLLPHYVSSRLLAATQNIPTDTEPQLVEDVNVNDRLSEKRAGDPDDDSEEPSDFPGRSQIVEFLRWLIYCDKVVGASDSVLGGSICGTVVEVLLESEIRPALCESQDEDLVALYTALLSKVITTIVAPQFSAALISWLCSDENGDVGEKSNGENSIRQKLLSQCREQPHFLRLLTLRLLQVMLEKPGSLAVQMLLLNYLCGRGYHDSSAAEHLQTSWSDEEDERYKQRDGKASECSSPGTAKPPSRTMAPSNINKIVKSFLTLVPEELRSTGKDDFDSYLSDAQRQYRETCTWCWSYGWPREALTPECPSAASSDVSLESKAEAEHATFYEGPLLQLLLDLLQTLPEQDYDINLQVTSLIASLSLLPHPHLHEFLLNPTLILSPGVRTPFTVMKSVVSRIQHPVSEREDFQVHLKVTRHQLLGAVDEFDVERDDEDRIFESLIVVEEFCKELSAIALAKYKSEGD